MMVSDFCTMRCVNCSFTDGLCYASYPPKYRCTFDNNFYDGYHACHLELVPMRHGRWIEEESDEVGDIFRCSECGHIIAEDFALMEEIQERGDRLYCDCCGAKMDLKE